MNQTWGPRNVSEGLHNFFISTANNTTNTNSTQIVTTSNPPKTANNGPPVPAVISVERNGPDNLPNNNSYRENPMVQKIFRFDAMICTSVNYQRAYNNITELGQMWDLLPTFVMKPTFELKKLGNSSSNSGFLIGYMKLFLEMNGIQSVDLVIHCAIKGIGSVAMSQNISSWHEHEW